MFNKSAKDTLYKFAVIITFILGIILRSYSFAIFRPLWRDECSLALSIYFGNFLDLWGVLYHTQSAPPIFMTICKLFNTINPEFPEYSLRIFPFLSGIISIFLFYFLVKKIFKSKLAIIISIFAFAVNLQLIYYSHEFKQYSTDVLVILGCILYLSKIRLSNLTTKQVWLNAFFLALLPLLSLPAVFITASWILLCFFKKDNIKSLIITLIPISVINILYYLFILKPSRKTMLENFSFLWEKWFLSFNFDSIHNLINSNLSFYFQQCNYIVIPLILVLIGLVFIIKRKLEIDKLILLTLALAIIASFLSIYPIQERVSLYLLPFIIILTVMPLNFSKQIYLKIIYIIMFCCILFGKNNYDTFNQNNESTVLMMQILKTNYKTNDFVVYNDMSDSQYKIYSLVYDFKVPNNRLGTIQLADYGEEWYYNVLNRLPKGNRYWFFYSYDLGTKPVIPFLKNWTHKNGKILYELYPDEKSCLLYVQL